MKTLESILAQLTGPSILAALIDLLHCQDPDFLPVEQDYHSAINILRHVQVDGLDRYLGACDQEVTAHMVYAGYLGYRVNWEHFRHPSGTDFLRLSHSDILKEHIMLSFPVCQAAVAVQTVFTRTLPDEYQPFCADIVRYYCYLDTIGPKLAHHAGYLIANQFLPWVEPGYQPDLYQTDCYREMLENLTPCSPFTDIPL